MATKEEWIAARLAYLRGLKAPTEMQRLLLLLADKTDRTPEEDKKLNALVRAEKAAAFAAKARSEAANLINAEKRAKAEAERKARAKRLIELGALFDLAGLDGQDRGALLGALLGVAKTLDDSNRWSQWKSAGDALLAGREAKPKQSEPPQQTPATMAGKEYREASL